MFHTYKQVYIASKSWKRIRGAEVLDFRFTGFM